MKQHPCHACNDREAHARWAERWWRLKRETDQLSGADPRAHGRGRAGLRPGHRRAARARLPGRDATVSLTRRRARPLPAPHLRRTRPAGRRVPAPRHLERPRRARARRPGQPRWSTSRAARAARRGSAACRAGPFRAALEATERDLGGTQRPRGGAPPSRERAAVGRDRAGHAALGVGRGARQRAARCRPRRRRLRALDEAGHRPARPDLDRRRRRARPHRARRDRRDPPRHRRLQFGGVA